MPRKGKQTSKKSNKKTNVDLHEVLSKNEETCFEEYKMLFSENRLKTFQDWPFDEDNSCNPKALAEAGFYHIPSNEAPDACRCFCCYKELDGWEPDDCPWKEHQKHSAKCEFLALKKPVSTLLINDVLKIHKQRLKNQIEKYYHTKIQELETHAKTIKAEIRNISG